ncbi:unnamed protein product [Rotaria sordida]|uniref:Uncharacterized protein n=1 Tax=Rotaria sordida TaxID=392033 RepID=A0A819TGV6_9BILA|nr:unnamed protein product [Rotaria sordida]
MLILNNYIYKLNKSTTKVNGDHVHPQEPEKVEIRTFKQILKERAINEVTPIPKIYDEESAKANLTTSSIAVLPSEREMST